MVYHSHASMPRMVPGLPNPDDPSDQLLLITKQDGSQWTYLALARAEWAPILAALRRLSPVGQSGGSVHRDT